jgi:hypothetical protein
LLQTTVETFDYSKSNKCIFFPYGLVPRNERYDNEAVQFARGCGQSSTICTTGMIIFKREKAAAGATWYSPLTKS